MSTQPGTTSTIREQAEAAIRSLGGFARMQDNLDQFSHDCEYLSSITEQMRKEHPDSWVVVYKGKVVGTGPVLEEVLQSAAARGVPRNLVAARYITKEPMRLIL
ncbi:MAG: hypothetical protein OXL97_04050 [Chloroflexota bacterium]|nr:hypothetical protein [Chloroflexota bacterium]MDE2883605.1 hypothetical protein [Chloroflexota bacterium]